MPEDTTLAYYGGEQRHALLLPPAQEAFHES
ncbi:hypothetical protein METHP14_60002 [Pseudomonas sp. P14-2025]